MTNVELAALMADAEFRSRIKVSALKYADSILNRPVDTLGINGQRTWAQRCQQSPDAIAQQLQPVVVMDAAVQSEGKDITDEALRGAVETQINKSF